jgi:hypothetical protein
VVSGVDSGSRVVAGRYRLLDTLGAGGMGTVWLAEDVVLGREVAVKEVTFPRGLSDEDRAVLRERTRREARAAARLDHPSAVTVFDVIEEDGVPYLVMEYVDARTLAQVVKADGPLSPQRTAEVGLALLGALEAAHAQGIVHRDVKPGNVMLTPDRDGGPGRVVLTDFGIATSTGDSSITSTGLLLGSPAYIAPERAKGEQPRPASDLWSLGATLFTAVEGRPPYDAGDPLLTVTAVVTGEHAPYVSAGPLVPVLDGLLERDPAKRLTARDARRALREVAASGTAADARPGARPAVASNPDKPAERTAALLVGGGRDATEPDGPAAGAAAAGTRAVDDTAADDTARAWVPAAAQASPPPSSPARSAARPARPTRTAVGPRVPLPAARRDDERPGRGGNRALPVLLGLTLLVVLGVAGFALSNASDPAPPASTAQQDRTAPAATSDGTPEGEGSPPGAPDAAPDRAPAGPSGGSTGGSPDRSTGGSPDASTGGSPDVSTGGAAGDDATPDVPAGWQTFTGGPGWTVAVPPSYRASTFQGAPQYKDRATGRTLRVTTSGPGGGKPDAVKDRQEQAAAFSKTHDDYREIDISEVDYRGYEAADWEFTYTSGGTPLHALSRVFVVDGRGYSLFFQTRGSDDWGAARAEFDRIAAAFQPAG